MSTPVRQGFRQKTSVPDVLVQQVKRATIAHWTAQPIGTRTPGFMSVHPEYGEAWFEDNARFRYEVYAPWLPEVAGFHRFARQRVLEIGCGLGADLAAFSRADAWAVGIDLTPHHVALAQRRLGLLGLPSHLAVADAECLPFRDETFDFVYSFGVLHHTPQAKLAMAEVYRVLRPEGKGLIGLYHRHSLHFCLTIVLGQWLPEQLRRLMRWDLRPFPISEVLNVSTDGRTNPLTRVFSAREGRDLCSLFREVRTQVRHLNPWDIPYGRFLPRRLRGTLAKRFGWYLLLEVQK